MGYHHIKYDVAEEIATITLNRPEARNALSTEMREDISNALEDIKERAGEDVKAVILTGERHCCAGGDVQGMANRQMTPMDQRNRVAFRSQSDYDVSIWNCPCTSILWTAPPQVPDAISLYWLISYSPHPAPSSRSALRIGLIPD